ncbi:MAG: hypothetical protein RI902_1723 [Pseudomonadota bacterium]|jgi:hypothetical protein
MCTAGMQRFAAEVFLLRSGATMAPEKASKRIDEAAQLVAAAGVL